MEDDALSNVPPRLVHGYREQRELSSIEATLGKSQIVENVGSVTGENKSHFKSKPLKIVQEEKASQISKRKQRLATQSLAEKESKEKEILLWETETLFTQHDYDLMIHLWEFPVIGILLSVPRLKQNMEQLSMFELERMFLMPQASKGLATFMTTLLSMSPIGIEIHTCPSMSYKVWAKELALIVSGWYKLYNESNNNPQIAREKFGMDTLFWKLFGDADPFKDYEFYELTFHQRVFLIKTLCDYIVKNDRDLLHSLVARARKAGVRLGEDRTGVEYIHFPEFLNHDVRIYKQKKIPKTWVERDNDHQAAILKEKAGNNNSASISDKKKPTERKSSQKIGKILKRDSHRNKKKQTNLKCVTTLTSERKFEVDKELVIVLTDLRDDPVFGKDENIMKCTKELRTPYCAPWLEPDPENFELVADSVEGVRQLLEKFTDDQNYVPLSQSVDSKKGESNRPECEVKLARALHTLIENLEPREHEFVLKKEKCREKMYEEWQDFMDRLSDESIEPNKAVLLNEKEPMETQGCEVPETPADVRSDLPGEVMEELPSTSGIVPPDALAGDMILQQCCIEHPASKQLTQCDSSDADEQLSEDKSEDCMMPKNRNVNANSVVTLASDKHNLINDDNSIISVADKSPHAQRYTGTTFNIPVQKSSSCSSQLLCENSFTTLGAILTPRKQVEASQVHEAHPYLFDMQLLRVSSTQNYSVLHNRGPSTARLVVVPGDDFSGSYCLVFPEDKKLILSPEQVAAIRAANCNPLILVFPNLALLDTKSRNVDRGSVISEDVPAHSPRPCSSNFSRSQNPGIAVNRQVSSSVQTSVRSHKALYRHNSLGSALQKSFGPHIQENSFISTGVLLTPRKQQDEINILFDVKLLKVTATYKYRVLQNTGPSPARFVVVPGDDFTRSHYGLVLSENKTLLLSPEQVAAINAANWDHVVIV